MDVFGLLSSPILRAPLIACFSMGIAAALMGVILLYQRQSLLGEALSHAAYPGLVLGILFSSLLSNDWEVWSTLLAFIGAFCTCMMGIFFIRCLRRVQGMSMDASLSFILATSFSLALLITSILQSEMPGIGTKAQALLLGQVATVSDGYAYTSLFFALLVILVIVLQYRSIQTSLFDGEFASVTRLSTPLLEFILLFLLSSSVMIGMKTMGVILLSSIFIFPAISSRYLARSLKGQLVCAAFLGSFVSPLGVLLSDRFSFQGNDPLGDSLWLPTGPLIVILFQGVFLLIFLFSWKEGVIPRTLRKGIFLFRCLCENALKGWWKECFKQSKESVPLSQALDYFPKSITGRFIVLQVLLWKGYIHKKGRSKLLTPLGLMKGQKLVRLHRLWELYLVRFCGMAKERVHPHAEVMEHILTPSIELELTLLLKNPDRDPHNEPIPPSVEEVF